VVSTQKQLDDDPRFNTLNKTKPNPHNDNDPDNENENDNDNDSFIHAETNRFQQETKHRHNNSSSSITGSIRIRRINSSSIISLGSCSICARLVLFWYAGERYAIGSKSSDLHLDVDCLFNLRQSIEPDSRSLVQQSFSPFALCRFSTMSIQSICQTSLVVASLGFGLGVDPIRASRFPSRFCLASAFVSFECRWYRDVIWSSVHPRSHSVILICVPVLPNVCKMCP